MKKILGHCSAVYLLATVALLLLLDISATRLTFPSENTEVIVPVLYKDAVSHKTNYHFIVNQLRISCAATFK